MCKLIAAAGLWIAILLGSVTPAVAQTTAPAAIPTATPAKVQELLQLLDDPSVRNWLASQPASSDSTSAAEPDSINPGAYMDQRLVTISDHLARVLAALPTLTSELGRLRDRLMREFWDRGPGDIVLLILAFLGLGILLEVLFWRATKGVQQWIIGFNLESSGERLRAAGIRLCFSLAFVLAFAIGSVGAFLAFDWPPLLRTIVLGYLSAFLILRVGLALTRFALAPGGERFRLVPMDTTRAWFWYRRLGVAIGWLSLGWVSVGLLHSLDVPEPTRVLIAYILGLGLLGIGIEAVWRRPRPEQHAGAAETPARRIGGRLGNWLVTAYFVLLWLLWVSSAMPAFWLMVVVVALPAAIRFIRRAVNHVLRPAGADAAPSAPGVAEICLDRGLRAILIIGAALLLAHAWNIDLAAMTLEDTITTRLLRGLLSAVVIVLVAEFLWHLLRAAIDSRLQGAAIPGEASDETRRRQARLRTLLPILRNVLMVVIFVIAALMVLSSMGIEIGPLIAGAGVVGVAVGFGAQTLVKDVISGMFYLLDDAFRVGEYIQSGSYKGTVESFSLRSVKLRHHRGPLYTVPFGELGAVQNMSRDWVIDKLTIGITYDSDLEKARKLIKEVGKTLAENPEFAPHILEPLKMQGVEQFGDFAIQIRMKMMTKPGEQFTIRRKALAMIRQTFNEHGIKFAFPTVQVAGGDTGTAAVAKQALDMAAAKPAEG